MQPRLLGATRSADSFSLLFWRLHLGGKALGESNLWERGGLWGAEEQELGTHGREEGLLQRHWEAGMSDSSQLYHCRAPPVEKLLGDLASRNLPLGRTGVGQRHGQWGTRELGEAW